MGIIKGGMCPCLREGQTGSASKVVAFGPWLWSWPVGWSIILDLGLGCVILLLGKKRYKK